MRSLDAYSRILDASSAEAVLLQLMVRHDCTIFAPFDGLSMGDQFPTLLAALPPARQAAFLQLLGDPRFVREQLSRITNTFWTWQPLNFADVDGSVICTPMLGLWNEYPTSHILAPPSPRELAPHLHNTADEIVHLLDNVYWQILETLFNAVRLACGLGVAEPEFYDIESRPPVFFFAEPTSPPVLPEAYADSLKMAIRPLVASCLLSNDPLADPMAWGVLEGDLVALRREMSRRRSFQSRYLLFPTANASSTVEPTEDKVRAIANQLGTCAR